MKNQKLKTLLDEAAALMRAELPADHAPGHFTWLSGALMHVETAASFYGSYEAAVEREQDVAAQQQRVAQIKQESAEEVQRHHADLAARAELRSQGETRPTPGHGA